MTEPRCPHGWLQDNSQCPICQQLRDKDEEIEKLKKQLEESHRYAVVLNKMLRRKR